MSKPETRRFYKEEQHYGDFRVSPQDLEAEQSALGAAIISQDAADTVLSMLVKEDFYREAHQHLYDAVKNLRDERTAVDIVTLTNELKRLGQFDAVGGISALTSLLDRVPTAANVEYYSRIVKEKAICRGLIRAGTQIVADAYTDKLPVRELMDSAEQRIFDATDRNQSRKFRLIKDIIDEVYNNLIKLSSRKYHITGVPYGFEKLDALTEGMQPSNFIVIGARPSVGKTALGLNIAWNAASGRNETGQRFPVGVFSLEMTEQEIGRRLLCSVGRVNWKQARLGALLESDQTRMVRAAEEIHETPIYVNDSSSLSVMELKSEARRMKKVHDIQLLVVDYLQLIHPGHRRDTREQEVAMVSLHLKALAKDLKIPVLCLSQLSRPQKGSESRKPILSDLRESGAIEQDADVVIFIHREEEKSNDIKHYKHELIVSKQRNGPLGDVPVQFDAWCTRFESFKPPERAPEPPTED